MRENNTIPVDVKELIADYLLGIIDHVGIKQLVAWMQSSDENKRLFNHFNDIWQASASDKGFEKADEQKLWAEILSRIQEKQPEIHTRNIDTPVSYRLIIKILGTAAFVAIIFAAGMYFQHARNPLAEESSVEYVEVTAPIGSRAYISMTDGSGVWLNAGTKLKYSNRFGKEDRRVDLTGEAYFSVAKLADLPFVIQAADVKITALGTAFNVKAYAEEGCVETSLESGSVKIERTGENVDSDESPIILQPNEKASLITYVAEKSPKPVEEKPARDKQPVAPIEAIPVPDMIVEELDDIRVSTSWKDSNWVIRSESMKSLAVKLSRRYDVNFVFKDKALEKYKFSTTLRDETLEQVLNMIQISAPISYTIQEKTVLLGIDTKHEKTFEKSIQ